MKDLKASKLTYLQVKPVPHDLAAFTNYGSTDYSLTGQLNHIWGQMVLINYS